LFADLASIRAISDPEKRSEAALTNADEDVDTARDAYKGGDLPKMRKVLEDLQGSIAIALDSLENAPAQARKSKYYKRAELRTRALARRLKTLGDEVSVDDRKAVDEAHAKVQEAHDHLLEDIMSNKK
jgi:hypothetical protein